MLTSIPQMSLGKFQIADTPSHPNIPLKDKLLELSDNTSNFMKIQKFKKIDGKPGTQGA